jgi:hypothetical protein
LHWAPGWHAIFHAYSKNFNIQLLNAVRRLSFFPIPTIQLKIEFYIWEFLSVSEQILEEEKETQLRLSYYQLQAQTFLWRHTTIILQPADVQV